MKFTPSDVKLFNLVFESSPGYILDFSDRTMREFFEDELAIDIDDVIYQDDGTSKAKRLRCFIRKSDKQSVLNVLDKLWLYKKSINPLDISPEVELSYLTLIEKLSNTDQVSSLGIKPQQLELINFNYSYFLSELTSMQTLSPQQRGYSFEKWLNQLFFAFHLAPKEAFSLKGEQIDGSFLLNNDIYLVEAKWHNKKTSNADLHVFQGKLDQKAAWTRGVFISWEGFTKNGLEAWGKGKSLICVSGYDLYYMLKNNISFKVLIEEKIRIAAETGIFYVKIDEIFPYIRK
ncbi:restriction endonuclease [Providencia hangzhouensis]|uniref:restriction endonuclease n=1 Tax=Providencia hangzhouensis TaxID=3031799 RepID=UPI0025A7F4AB|nr:restriction endonuclease [Providencia rettgeri]